MFLHFIPTPPMPPGPLTNFNSALAESHYIYALGFFHVAPAILLLINRYVPLALTVLAGMIVNIDLVHITMAQSGLPVAALVSILWLLVFLRVKGAFSGIFEPYPQH